MCYKTLAIRLLYLCCESGVSTVGHQRARVGLEYFKMVFLEILNIPLRRVFSNPVTYIAVPGFKFSTKQQYVI